ncbi:Aldo/keto reductase [Fistulina hepatica ATCC 64428]|uniref:Aldo/keto reductase n=1 Tax=Fistulina hepatica ATCC 64428 TaxID=1128425 RepID=A0A0D7ANH4_9AGAR|nr:Aldo/keto reductase [Fistulina hepatica ATCC 64428]
MSAQVTYRRLGSSGLRVSVPIVGAMSFGSKQWQAWVIEEEEAHEVLKAAWDRGVNTIDTSNAYSNGVSETIVGNFIKKYNIPRHKIIIATKCYFMVAEKMEAVMFRSQQEYVDDKNYVNQFGLSRAAIFNAVEASLARLQTSYIDLLQIHRFDPNTPVEETMKALHDLVQSGKVRYIGASSMRCWQFALMNEVAREHNWTTFVSMQNEYSLLYREEEREMLAYCKFHGIGVIPWGPLNRGVLARPVQSPETTRHGVVKTMFDISFSDADIRTINKVEEIAKNRGWSMAQVALTWVSSKVASPITGVSSVKRLEESLMIGSFELTKEECEALEAIYQPKPVRGHL